MQFRLFFLILFFYSSTINAQVKWDLKSCIEYALKNNISIKQQDIQARVVALTYYQSKLSQLPSASFGINSSYNTGRHQDPVTFSLITEGYLYSGYTLQVAADLFNWGSKRNTATGNQIQMLAARASVEKLSNDIALNVAGAYLQVLLSIQQENVSTIQVNQTKSQLQNTRNLVSAGNLPELNQIQLEAQLANDSSNLISAQGNVIQAMLLLKAYLNLDAGTPFDITTPDVESIPLENLVSLQPEVVYQLALNNLPQQRINDLNIRAAHKFISAARGAMYPDISLFASVGTSFNNKATAITGATQIVSPVGKVTVNGSDYQVYPIQPLTVYSTSSLPYFQQINQFLGQSIGISLSVPIANGGILKTNYLKSKLNLENLELQKQNDNMTLKQNIYKAYTDAMTSMSKFNASKKTEIANQKAFEFATKRYNVGLMNTIDLLTTQNNLYNARQQKLLAEYDYVFKMKVLEFYKGEGIKL